MSIKLMSQVWEMDGLSTSEKLLLLKLADNASDECYCFPSKAKIAKQCGFTKESVRRIIKRLEEQGLIERDPRFKDGRQSSNGYLLTLPPPIGDSTPLPSAIAPPPLPADSTQRTTSKETSKNQQEKEVLDHLNNKLGTKFRTATGLKTRFEEGFTVEDAKKVIDIKFAEWIGDEKMKQYIRPVTLFSNKMDQYLNQEVKVEKPESRDLAADYFNN